MAGLRRLVRGVANLAGGMRWAVVYGVVGGVVLVAALLAVIVYLAPLARYPGGLTSDQLATHVDTLRGQILQGLGGLALLGTLYFSARTLRLNRRGQLTERFGKAVEQLGSDKLAVRLGGIYALEQIALDSEELHWPVMEVLTAFLRQPSGSPKSKPVATARTVPGRVEDALGAFRPPDVRLPADRQAIATVLARRPMRWRRYEMRNNHSLDLSNAWLAGVDLASGNLARADLTGAHLEEAHLMWAHLEGSFMFGAHLDGALLVGAHLERAKLGGWSTWGIEGAKLKDAWLVNAHLEGAFLQETDITREQLEKAHIDASTVLPEHLKGEPEEANSDRR